MMNIDAIGSATQVQSEKVVGKTVVVIDVLRATSVMVTALNNGLKYIYPVTSPEKAIQLKKAIGNDLLLGGERAADLIPGFDLGNSPMAYQNVLVKGKSLIMTTTNGTLAINNAKNAKELVIGSFLNDQMVANYLCDKGDVVLVCAGTNGEFSSEDALCAGRIIYLIKKTGIAIHLSDFALFIGDVYEKNRHNLIGFASSGHHYNVLKSKGYEADLTYCFKTSEMDILPIWDGEKIKAHDASCDSEASCDRF